MTPIGKHLKLCTGHKFIITNCITIRTVQRDASVGETGTFIHKLNDNVLKLGTFYVRSINREKRPISFVISFPLSARTSADSTGPTSVRFYIEDFHENLPRSSKNV